MNIINKLKNLANNTEMKYIDMNITDWARDINNIIEGIEELKKDLNSAQDKYNLWKLAKFYRKKIDKVKE